jgi:hypothetical protein
MTATFEINMQIFKTQFLMILIFLLSVLAVTAQEKSSFVNVPTVSYCELVREPAKYDKQILRVRGNYLFRFEVSNFSDVDCESSENTAWVEFDQSAEEATDPEVLKKLRRLSKAKLKNRHIIYYFGGVKTEILVIARFDGIKPTYTVKSQNGTTTRTFGFGHLSAYNYRLTVLAFEAARPFVKKAP